jgi:5,10-methenyltetrahydromethanopterin hydrogenase
MARYVHFVIAVDLDDKSAVLDDDTFMAKFPDGGLWDDVSEEWRDETDEECEQARILMREMFKND